MTYLRKDQWWKDATTGDLLRILSFSEEENGRYVRTACYVNQTYFGVQEMLAQRFESGRFLKVGWVKSLWYRYKFRGTLKVKPQSETYRSNAPGRGEV